MLCDWKGCEVAELNIKENHIHLVVSVPPKVAKLIGIFESEVSDKTFQELSKAKGETILGKSFLAREYFVSTIGLEEMIRQYV